MKAIVWERSGESSTWLASAHGAVLSVTRQSLDRWAARVTWDGDEATAARSPVQPTKAAAMRWAEREAARKRARS